MAPAALMLGVVLTLAGLWVAANWLTSAVWPTRPLAAHEATGSPPEIATSPADAKGHADATSPADGKGRAAAGSPADGKGRAAAGSPADGKGRAAAGSPADAGRTTETTNATDAGSSTPPPNSPTANAGALAQTADLPPAGDGALPQTTDRPSGGTAVFAAEMGALWQAIQSGDPAGAAPAFFPEGAYLQLKSLPNDTADYTQRLLVHFRLDIAAAHRLLGPGAGSAPLTETRVPDTAARWVPRGACYNRLGYWHVAGARLVYQEGGRERSLGIASLISWRGYWYVIHLGAVVPPSGRGVVDSPSSGTGGYSGQGGC